MELWWKSVYKMFADVGMKYTLGKVSLNKAPIQMYMWGESNPKVARVIQDMARSVMQCVWCVFYIKLHSNKTMSP